MTEQNTNQTTQLSSLAELAAANSGWWKSDALDQRSELELPPRVLNVLAGAGIRTVEELKAAGPHKLRKLDGIGKLGFNQIIDLLQALDRQANGGDT